MQINAADSSTYPVGKTGLDRSLAIYEADPAEVACIDVLQSHSQLGQRSERIGHQAFAAGFIDRRLEGSRQPAPYSPAA